LKPPSSIIAAENQKRSQEHTGIELSGIEAFPDRHNHFATLRWQWESFSTTGKKLSRAC